MDDFECQGSANVSDHIEIGCPSLKLPLPCSDGQEQNDHQEGPILVHFVEEVEQE